MGTLADRAAQKDAFRSIAKRIGTRLRDELADPEGDALPAGHVDLLLQLRHRERAEQERLNRTRRS